MVVAGVPATASAADYVAMGDSYSSGTGTRQYYEGCERSVYAYPYLIQSSLGSSFSFIACGGAKTQDVLNNQVSRLDASTRYATISVGGNDAGFSSVITECAKPVIPFTSNPCTPAVNNAQNFINNTLPGRLDSVYNAIRNNAPNAVVAVVGYPRLFNGEDCNAATFFSGAELNSLNQTADILANVTRTRAQAHGFTFVDARPAFLGHAVCDNTEWLNGLSNPTSESYHPNATGHSQGYASIVRAALLAAPQPGAPVGGVGRIGFASDRDGNAEVYAVNADGGFPVNLTNNPAADIDPAWSPDGTKVAFASNRDGDNEIYVMNGDGSGLTQLTSNTADDREPSWSPNGALIAFRSNRTGNNEIFKMSANGASQTNVTNNSASDFAPDWSPDGAEIAWQRFGSNNEVYRANADGQGQTNLTNNGSNDGAPAWAPTGYTLAFHSNRDGDFEIFTMAVATGAVTQRTANGSVETDPTWSPTGAHIAFQSNRDGNDEIYSMTSTGGSQTNRTRAAGSDTGASWQADSTPPRTTVTAGPSGPTRDATPQFEFSASELGSALQCRVDEGTYRTCASPYELDELDEGEHTFRVQAIDPAGNTESGSALRTFLVDTTAPELSVTCPQNVLLGVDASATVEATDELSGFTAGEDPTGEHPVETSQPGRQTFTVEAVDAAGNRASDECGYTVRYPDPGAPGLSSGGTPNAGDFELAWTPSAPPEFGLAYTLQRRDADGEWAEVASGLAAPTRAFAHGDRADEGTWRYRVKGVDAVNDLETGWSAQSDEVKVDQSAPAAPSLAPGRAPEYAGDGGWFRDAVTVITSDRGDPALRDGSAGSGVDPASVAAPETFDASTVVRRSVRDWVGHSSDEASLRVQVDASRPKLALDCPTSVLLKGRATVKVTASDSDSGLADDPTGLVAVDTRKVGIQVIERTATDKVGHERTERCEVLVRYRYGGLREPVDPEGTSVFDAGSTIPLKTTLTDADDVPVAGARIEVHLERLSSAADDAEVEEVVEAVSTNAKAFGDDGKAKQYQFNLSTEGLAAGTWNVRLTLDDGTVHRTRITLR